MTSSGSGPAEQTPDGTPANRLVSKTLFVALSFPDPEVAA